MKEIWSQLDANVINVIKKINLRVSQNYICDEDPKPTFTLNGLPTDNRWLQ